MNRYVLLDRDGVINVDSDEFIKSPDEWLPIEGSLEAIALLNKHGFKIAVITNQSGLARGLFDEDTLTAIHYKMCQAVLNKGGRIEAIYYCPHGSNSNCNCRKPKAGLLLQCANEHRIDLTQTVFIGDSLRDMQAAIAAHAQPILVKTGKGLETFAQNPNLSALVFNNLYDASQFLISR